MLGFQRLIQLVWLTITVTLVVLHGYYETPLHDVKDLSVFLGLLALAIRSLLSVWRWADLAWRKSMLWLLNTSVNWTLEVRVAMPEAIEDADIEVLLDRLRKSRQSDRVARLTAGDSITLELANNYTVSIRPFQTGMETFWILRFNPVHIGYRDASHILRRVFIPVIGEIGTQLENPGPTKYAIEARFARINPYAAVLLNELRAKSADTILLTFKHDRTTVMLTKDSIVASSDTQDEAIHTMSTVFGLSLRGAFGAGNI